MANESSSSGGQSIRFLCRKGTFAWGGGFPVPSPVILHVFAHTAQVDDITEGHNTTDEEYNTANGVHNTSQTWSSIILALCMVWHICIH